MISPPEPKRNLRSDPSGQFHPRAQSQSTQESSAVRTMIRIAAARCVHCGQSKSGLMKHAILGECPAAPLPVGYDELRGRLFCQTMQHALCAFFAGERTCDAYRQNAVSGKLQEPKSRF